MTRARQEQISLDDTPFYHCMVRCVRRAFLFGDDKPSGRNFDHRKQWIVLRFKQLASVFAIDVCAYAVMSNHYHLVLFADEQTALRWTDKEVVERWLLLFNGHLLVDRWLSKALSLAEEEKALEIIGEWRKRLTDISWFMRCMNESVARQANEEDGCKGRFWEGRFKSQALLDDSAVLSCMVYVDLNPIRAGIADSPENSDFTSIQERLSVFSKARRVKNKVANIARNKSTVNQSKSAPKRSVQATSPGRYLPDLKIPLADLKAFDNRDGGESSPALNFNEKDYFELLDWTGRAIREEKGKRGAISKNLPPILQRLGVESKDWFRETQHFESRFKQFAGSLSTLEDKTVQLKQKWLHGMGGMTNRKFQYDGAN